MQILGLFGTYFDAVVVEVEKYLLFSDWLGPYYNLLLLHYYDVIKPIDDARFLAKKFFA